MTPPGVKPAVPDRLPAGVRIRPAEPADLPACARIWREGINDYLGRLNQREIPDDLAAISRLHAHLLATDPATFLVAVRGKQERDGEQVVAFGAATRREGVWFLSMLFVKPGEQGAGLGRALLERILPADGDPVLATATDSQQPISNAMYAAYGMVPRMPLLNFVGRPPGTAAFGALPAGVEAVPFDDLAGDANRELAGAVDSLDREVTGFAHPADHHFLRLEGRHAFIFREGERILGYGYAGESGRVGPIAVRDEALLAPALGHVLAAVEPRGASALWVPGLADRAVVPLLRAGFRLDQFPVLLCWTRPFADFRRYVPISPGLL
ncbi:MAG: GNAT family N-acetyltransferase [Chloroflexota bacterium]